VSELRRVGEDSIRPGDGAGSLLRTIRIDRPEYFGQPGFRRFATRALEGYHPAVPIAALLAEVGRMVIRPDFGLFLSLDGTRPRAIGAAMKPSPLMMLPQILFGYNEGPRIYGRAVMERLREFLVGYDKALALNTKHRDAVFLRTFRAMGEGKVTGSVVEFTL
jgi:hypothetical protein